MKKVISIILILVLAFSILSGCSFDQNVKADTIFIEKDGSIEAVSIETFDKDYYKDSDLKKYAQQQVKSYQESHTGSTVKLKKISVKQKQAKLYMQYSDYKAYATFNHSDFFAGTVAKAVKAGYAFDSKFYDATKAKEAIDPSTEQMESINEKNNKDTEYEQNTQATTENTSSKDTKYKDAEDIKDVEQLNNETETIKSRQQSQQSEKQPQVKAVDRSRILEDDSLKVVIVQENTNVEIKGKILYVSGYVKVTGDHTATVTNEGEDNTNVAPAYIIYQ